MTMRLRFGFPLLAAALLALAVVSLAAGAVIREGAGVGKARLGQVDTAAAASLGKHTGLQRDPNYGSRVVYVIGFGKKSGGRYPLEMLSSATHRIFQFSFNSSAYATARGIKVGSSEAKLVAAYSGMKRIHTPKFNHYIWGRRPYTDFWVLNSSQRVYQVIVRSK